MKLTTFFSLPQDEVIEFIHSNRFYTFAIPKSNIISIPVFQVQAVDERTLDPLLVRPGSWPEMAAIVYSTSKLICI